MSDLFDALRSGSLKAFARLNSAGATVTEIPVAEWSDMVADVRGPYRHPNDGGKDYTWINIQVRRVDVEKLWRRISEKQARTKFDGPLLQTLFAELRSRHDDMSQNELIENLQADYQDKTGKEPPSRSTVQRQMRDW